LLGTSGSKLDTCAHETMALVKAKAGAMKSAMKVVMKGKRVSKIAKGRGAKAKVFRGKKEKTVGGLFAADLMRNKWGKVVSKKMSAKAKNNSWFNSLGAARKTLGITGFVLVNRGPEGQALYAKSKVIHATQ